MEHLTLDFGPFGAIPLQSGAVLRIGDASVLGADLVLPQSGVHILAHGRPDGVLIVNCSTPPQCVRVGDQIVENQFFKPGESLRIGSMEVKFTGAAAPVPTSLTAARVHAARRSLFAGLVAATTVIASLWSWESWRVGQVERAAALRLGDQSLAMLAESLYGSGDATAAFYNSPLCERWLDRILTVDVRRDPPKALGYQFHLDEDPLTGAVKLVAHAKASVWRQLVGLGHRSFSCDLSQPQLLLEEGEEVDWAWLGGEMAGMVVPRRLQRRGIQPIFLYNAERYRGFTWPLREMAREESDESLRSVLTALGQLPGLTLQVFPDRKCETALWQALANLGEEETFLWELSPDFVPSVPSRKASTLARLAAPAEPAEAYCASPAADGPGDSPASLTE